MSKSNFEEQIACHGRLIYTNKGNSMAPLIQQGRDLLVIERAQGRLKKYDVPLYRRDSGQYVLHRILKVRKNDYVMCGDNRYKKEFGVSDSQIIGVLTTIIRNGRELSVNDKQYRIYVHLWCDFFPIRAVILICIKAIRKAFTALNLSNNKPKQM